MTRGANHRLSGRTLQSSVFLPVGHVADGTLEAGTGSWRPPKTFLAIFDDWLVVSSTTRVPPPEGQNARDQQ